MAASNVPQLLQEAADFVQMFEYQQAVDKFHEAYQLEPENTEVLDNLAEVLLELGEVEDAHNISFSRHTTRSLPFSQLLPFLPSLWRCHYSFPSSAPLLPFASRPRL